MVDFLCRRRGPVERPGQRRKQKSRPLNVMSKRSPPKKKAVMQKLGSSKPAQPIKAAALAVRKEGKVAKRSPAAKHTSESRMQWICGTRELRLMSPSCSSLNYHDWSCGKRQADCEAE